MLIALNIVLIIIALVIAALCVMILKKNNNDQDSTILENITQLGGLTREMNEKNSQFLLKNFGELRETLVLRQEESRDKINKEIGSFKLDMKDSLHKEFVQLNKILEDKLEKISSKVRENLDEGFKKTNETFANVIARLAKIDEAQKKIESLSSNVVELQDVLTDKKSRGIFGEIQLSNVLSAVFGEKNDKIYDLQYKLSNGKIVDSILFMPEPTGRICVDSKFPLENFKRMYDKTLPDSERELASKEFGRNVKKHVDDIASKYIITGETSDQAIMFLPAEAIFAELHAYHGDVVDYANSKRVWLASPTTFMATLTTLQSVIINIERNKYMTLMHEEINKLGDEFKRYQDRWSNLSKHLQTVTKDIDQINTTSNKISSRFERILQVEIAGTTDSLLDEN
ncbi:RmuC domain protein [Bacteriovorax sp. BSW11_IV]|uniref:DNA recombination protein RmuC n=1 Tax=Bacteriovorax sp. BSW11_IV TaxID=1353529 RepID=UPI000389F992|nr:DNA recombination protein RmuC [Bacteriovorax sp. BSW11_IV]EQC48880.1 RmuC domain protein [Bacteriovorax sp. BSW11_IV]